MEIDVSDLKRHELTAPGKGFVRDAEHRPLAIGSQPIAGAVDEFLDVLPVQGMRLVLASGGPSTHPLQSQPDGFT